MIKLMISIMQLAFLPTKDVKANIQELAFVILMFVTPTTVKVLSSKFYLNIFDMLSDSICQVPA